ncbi:MAG: DNA mismatch repair protein MutS [Nitrosomonadaceae bacterium]|nr:DNA mismatch repair protein MutS [Nitrosomonadaceae bacterium]|tara:strand:- start:734 stop:1264 length:531 start_codon:yes stop_codon:yes gene_type:complete
MDKNDEDLLFRDAVQDVEPMPIVDKVQHSPKRPRPVIRKNTIPSSLLIDCHNSISKMESGDEYSFVRSGVSRKTLKHLRQGHWNIDDRLDLHGFTSEEALRELDEFLNICSINRFRCVQIIHGKGLNSKNREPVLKKLVWNRLKFYKYILAFCQAGSANGGSGAVMVLLKSSRKIE